MFLIHHKLCIVPDHTHGPIEVGRRVAKSLHEHCLQAIPTLSEANVTKRVATFPTTVSKSCTLHFLQSSSTLDFPSNPQVVANDEAGAIVYKVCKHQNI